MTRPQWIDALLPPAIPPSVRRQANDLLDAARNGMHVPDDRMDWALRMTGDLNERPACHAINAGGTQ